MLSQNLRCLHVWFVECMHQRAEFTVEGCQKFERMLAEAVETAEAMEATPLDLAVGEMGSAGSAPPTDADNVVPFPAGRVRRPGQTGGSVA